MVSIDILQHERDEIAEGSHIEWIPAAHLMLGARYQRERNEPFVQKLVKDWDIRKVGLIFVARNESGANTVFDGGHRTEAAMRVDPWLRLPCSVWPGLSEADQARMFIDLTRDRRPMRPHDVFWAGIVAGLEEEVAILQIVTDAGYEMARSEGLAGKVYAYAGLRQLYRSDKGEALRLTLDASMRAWGPSDPPITRGLQAVGAFIVQYKGEYDHKRLVTILQRIEQRTLVAKARAAMDLFVGYAGAQHGGRYVAALYNNGLRSGRLPEWRPGRNEFRAPRGRSSSANG